MFLNAKKYYYGMLVLCLVLLVIPVVLREVYNNGFIFGEESYTNLRISQYIKDNNKIPTEDPYSYGGRPFVVEYGMPLLMAFHPSLLSKIIPIVFGLLSFVLFYFIISQFYPKVKGLASLLFITSPPFIYLFSTATKHSAAVLLGLLGLYLFVNGKKKFSLAAFIFVGFFSFLASLFILLIYLVYSIYKNRFNEFYILLLGNFFVFLLQFYRFFTLGLPKNLFLREYGLGSIPSILFSDFGSIFGFGVFLFFLGLMGTYVMWERKYKFILFYFILALISYLTLYFNFLVFYINLFLVVTASFGIMHLLEKEWKIYLFKQFTVLVLICGLLFSTLAYYDRVNKFTPNNNFVEGLEFLYNTDVKTNIFSHYTRGVYLSYGGMKNFMDSNFLYAPNLYVKWSDAQKLLYSNDLEQTIGIMGKYNLEYVWVDQEMIDSLWGGDDRDLLFLLKYNPHVFEKVFDNGDVQIYKKK